MKRSLVVIILSFISIQSAPSENAMPQAIIAPEVTAADQSAFFPNQIPTNAMLSTANHSKTVAEEEMQAVAATVEVKEAVSSLEAVEFEPSKPLCEHQLCQAKNKALNASIDQVLVQVMRIRTQNYDKVEKHTKKIRALFAVGGIFLLATPISFFTVRYLITPIAFLTSITAFTIACALAYPLPFKISYAHGCHLVPQIATSSTKAKKSPCQASLICTRNDPTKSLGAYKKAIATIDSDSPELKVQLHYEI